MGAQATQANAERSRRRAAENLAAAVAGVTTLEAELDAAGGRFAYLQQLRAYIADLCDMLQARLIDTSSGLLLVVICSGCAAT